MADHEAANRMMRRGARSSDVTRDGGASAPLEWAARGTEGRREGRGDKGKGRRDEGKGRKGKEGETGWLV